MRDAWGLSTSEARRLIAQGGVEVDGRPWASHEHPARERRPARSLAPASLFVRFSGA